MRDAIGPGTVLGYCTNVHAGADWPTTRANLERYAPAVKAVACPDRAMGVGLWLSARTARELIEADRVGELRDLLDAHGLLAYTINGFPYGDFHQPVVKHRVYEPDWTDERRARYTRDLATILAALIEEGEEGSISTLPIGWPRGGDEQARCAAAGQVLLDVAGHLHRLEQETGRLVHLDLEPEPGCLLQDCGSVCAFFDRHVFAGADALRARRFLRVCHDVCHAAVMRDDQRDAFARYRDAGIGVGKVQVSSAVRLAAGAPTGAIEELAAFGEDRYLHQTTVWDGRTLGFYEDLPEALAARRGETGDEWRVHYHVPVYLDGFGHLDTTSDFIAEALPGAAGCDARHYEVETYAWNVLPDPLRVDCLASGIARELRWVVDLVEGMRR